MHIATRGLVLRETAYKESDKILTVLTEEGGKRTVKARGCRKKGSALAAPAQLLVWSDMVLVEYRDRFTLKEAATVEEFRGLRADLDRLALGSYFAEAAEAAAQEGVPQPELLALLLNCLYALDRLQNKPLPLVKTAFELRLLCESGYEPMADRCVRCGEENPDQPRLDLSQGTLRCAACAGEGGGISMPLTPSALEALRYITRAPARKILSFDLSGPGLTRLGDLAEAYLMTQLERGFRTLDFYKSLNPRAPGASDPQISK